MTFSQDDLRAAALAGILDQDTFQRLTGFLAARASLRAPAAVAAATNVTAPPRFDLAHLLWYAGALIIITGMGTFTTVAFSALGGKALVMTGLLYAVAFVLGGRHLWNKGLTTPGGLMIAIAVSLVPLIVFGIQDEMKVWSLGDPGIYRNFFDYINGSWIWMEVATIAAAALALVYFPFGFIMMIAAVALWFMSMDIVVFLKSGTIYSEEWSLRREVSLVFGLVMILIGWGLDLNRNRRTDYGFWLHLFGMIAFWNALTWREPSTELAGMIYCALNVGFLLFSVYLGRRVYAVFGTIGIATYLGHLSYTVFKDAVGFTFALTAIGVLVIWLGLIYNKNQARLAAWFDDNLPGALKALRPHWPH